MEKSLTLIQTIISLAQTSNYGSVADYYLYKCMDKTAQELKPELNKLYAEKLITVSDVKVLNKEGRKAVKSGSSESLLGAACFNFFKSIKPTTDAYLKNPAIAHPVSKADCLTVFIAVRGIEIRNGTYCNASYKVICDVAQNKIGAIKLDVALAKLVVAGYITENKITPKTTIYQTTKLGMDQMAIAIKSI